MPPEIRRNLVVPDAISTGGHRHPSRDAALTRPEKPPSLGFFTSAGAFPNRTTIDVVLDPPDVMAFVECSHHALLSAYLWSSLDIFSLHGPSLIVLSAPSGR